MVASLVTLFKKLKFGTDENVGWGPIDLPELELQTTAYWLTAEVGYETVIRAGRGVAASGDSAHVSSNTLAESPRPRLTLGTADDLAGSVAAWRRDELDVAAKALALRLLSLLSGSTTVREPRRRSPTGPRHDVAEELVESGPRVRTQISRP